MTDAATHERNYRKSFCNFLTILFTHSPHTAQFDTHDMILFILFLEPCEEFFRKLADEIGLEFQCVYPSNEKKPTIILSWIGSRPQQPSIMLNSHMDVVPVFEEFWTHAPFSADIDEQGRIFARGSQDMKSVGMQYLAAIHRMKRNNVVLERTLHVTFVPDEENFGPDGMKAFSTSDVLKKLNVGFVMDEGVASPDEVFNVYYGERSCWRECNEFECSF